MASSQNACSQIFFFKAERKVLIYHFCKGHNLSALIKMIKYAVTALYIPGKCFLCAFQTRISDTMWEKLKKSVFGVCFYPGGGLKWINGKSQ